jgi:hypothetical protein
MDNNNTTSQPASAQGSFPTTNGDPADLVPLITRLKEMEVPVFGPLARFLRQELTAAGHPPTAPLPHLLVSFPQKNGDRPQPTLLHESSDAMVTEAIERSFNTVPIINEAHRQSLGECKALIHRTVAQNAATEGVKQAMEIVEHGFNRSPFAMTQIIELVTEPIRLALPAHVFAITSELLLTAVPLGIACGLNALQLFAEGRLDRLLQGHRVLQFFATLSPEERETARVWVIYALKWEAIYDPHAESTPSTNINS